LERAKYEKNVNDFYFYEAGDRLKLKKIQGRVEKKFAQKSTTTNEVLQSAARMKNL